MVVGGWGTPPAPSLPLIVTVSSVKHKVISGTSDVKQSEKIHYGSGSRPNFDRYGSGSRQIRIQYQDNLKNLKKRFHPTFCVFKLLNI